MDINKQEIKILLMSGIRSTKKGKLISEQILSLFIDRYLASCLRGKWLITGPIHQFLTGECGIPREDALAMLAEIAINEKSMLGVEMLPPDQSFPTEKIETQTSANELEAEFEIEEEEDDRLTLVDEDWDKKGIGFRRRI